MPESKTTIFCDWGPVMKSFRQVAAFGSFAVAIATLMFATSAFAGGDMPFPFSGDRTDITLAETWDSHLKNVQFQVYKTEAGETFVIMKDLTTGEFEVLVKTK